MPNIIFLGCSEKCDESSLITDDSEVDTALHIKLLITVEIFPFGRAGPILQCLQSKILAMLSRHCFCHCAPSFHANATTTHHSLAAQMQFGQKEKLSQNELQES